MKLKIKLLKIIDRLLGSILVSCLPAASVKKGESPRSILFIRPGGIGDAVLLAPAIQLLRLKFPKCAIDVLAEQRNAGVFQLIPDVHDVLLYDKGLQILSALRSRYDVVIDTEQWHRLPAVVARMISARQRIGFGTNERRKMFTDVADYSHDVYEVQSFMSLLEPLGIVSSLEKYENFLRVPDEDQLNADGKLSLLSGRPFVTIFPGASIIERHWGWSKYTELAGRLVQAGLGVVVVGGEEDRVQGNAVLRGLDRAINFAGQCSLAGSAAVIRRASLLVTGDSGVLHIGAGVGTPTVSLFGAGIEDKWAPRGRRHNVVNKHLNCSPCTRYGNTPKCPINVDCMRKITVDEVYNASIELLQAEGLV